MLWFDPEPSVWFWNIGRKSEFICMFSRLLMWRSRILYCRSVVLKVWHADRCWVQKHLPTEIKLNTSLTLLTYLLYWSVMKIIVGRSRRLQHQCDLVWHQNTSGTSVTLLHGNVMTWAVTKTSYRPGPQLVNTLLLITQWAADVRRADFHGGGFSHLETKKEKLDSNMKSSC